MSDNVTSSDLSKNQRIGQAVRMETLSTLAKGLDLMSVAKNYLSYCIAVKKPEH